MKKKSLVKRIVVSLVLVFTFGFSFGFQNLVKPKNFAYALDSEISNGDFTNPSSGSSNPYTPNNFTQVGMKNGDIKAGIIYLDESNFNKYQDDYGLTGSINNYADKGVSPNDDKALLINYVGEREGAYSGFKSDDFTLKANKFYKLSLYARTINGAHGSIVLSDTSTDDNLTIPKLNSLKLVTSSGWSIYTFYIQTNKIVSTDANLTLWLGENNSPSLGGMLFDTIKLTEIDETSFYADSSTDTNANVIKLTNNVNKVDLIKNPSFETDGEVNTDNWTLNQSGQYSKAEIANLQTSIDTNLVPGDYKNSTTPSYGYVMYASEEGYATVTSDEFIIKQNEIIELSFYAKLSSSSTKATVKIYSTDFYKNDEKVDYGTQNYSATATINATTNNNTNNYGLFKFLIKGNYFYDTAVKIDLNLGSSDSKTSGYVVFDEFLTYRLNPEMLTASSSSENVTNLNLYVGSVDSGTVKNGFFNFNKNVEYNADFTSINYPIKNVAEFEATYSNENNSVSGIIDVNPIHFASNSSKYGTTTNPNSPSMQNNDVSVKSTNNVLMLRNINAGVTTFTSSDTKSLTKNSFYKFSVDAYRDKFAGVVGDAYLKLFDSDKNELASIKIDSPSWQNKQIFVKTGLVNSTTVSIALCLGSNQLNANGNVYFDNLNYETSTEDAYNTALSQSSTNIVTVDLSNPQFNHGVELVEGENSLYKTNQFTLDENSSEYAKLGVYNVSPVGNSSNSVNGVFMLKNAHEGVSSATSSLKFNVDTNAYYKLSVYAKIKNISCENATDENYGAFIGLSNYKLDANRFVNLKDTKDINNSETFKKFEFVIFPDQVEDLQVVVGLGSERSGLTTNVSGEIYIDRIQIETITSNDFENYDPNAVGENIVGIKIGTDIESDDDAKPSKGRFEFNWWYFSSIILALTLIVVMVGLLIKKVEWKKIFHKDEASLAEYDTRRIENEQKALAKKELRARKRMNKKKK